MENVSVKYGVMGGAATIIVSLLLWFIDPKVFLDYSWINYIVIIVFMILAGKEAKENDGGYIEFGDIFKHFFITFLIITLFSTVFQYILYNIIDPNLIVMAKEMAIEAMEKITEAFGDEEMAETLIEQIEDKSLFTIGQMIQSWVFGLILGAIFSAILALIMKKKDPEFSDFV